MVYNALKLFMEINPDLFDASMHEYKQKQIESARFIFMSVLWLLILAQTATACHQEI